MNPHRPTQDIGKKGEQRALNFLLEKGYLLRERNFRHKRSEIDLILTHGPTLVFVEVKFRSTTQFGHPEEFVSANQQQSILNGAEYYIESNEWTGNIRFDIVAIDAEYSIEHFEDAFY